MARHTPSSARRIGTAAASPAERLPAMPADLLSFPVVFQPGGRYSPHVKGNSAMGQEILTSHFSEEDFVRFKQRLAAETAALRQWFEGGRFVAADRVAGFELEAWLVDSSYRPRPLNERFLAAIDTEWVSPELSQFNVELNVAPEQLQGDALHRLEQNLSGTWNHCCEVASTLDADLVMIGILPSVREEQLTLDNMSRMKRYRALNEQIFRLRRGRPLQLDIVGREHLRTTHHNVMLESAATSFQIHLQVSPEHAARFYNASLVASAATVAVSANSPYLFGRDLWDETRIPLFEQAVEVGGYDGAVYGPLRRVSFGSGYVRDSLLECFEENYEHFPVLLPMHFDDTPKGLDTLDHLRLHNGTIWRWNRPLIGIDRDGKPHLRIEHRVAASGPTVADLIANAAFYYGLVHSLATMSEAPEHSLSFSQARDNFYAAARQGLDAHVGWLGDKRGLLRGLILDELLAMARNGLQLLDLDTNDIHRYLGIIEARVRRGRNGAHWQRGFAKRNGRDMLALTAAYAEHQHSGVPVHDWTV